MQWILFATLISTLNGQFISDPRIVGGYEVSPKFKYNTMVSLEVNKRHLCGGTILNKNTIITAAHCVIYDDKDWTAVAHRHDLALEDSKEDGKRFTISKRTRHPQFDHSKFDLNDVSIWKVDGDFGLPSYNVVIDDGKLAESKNVLLTTIGWGATAQGASQSKLLLEVKLPTYDVDRCVNSYATVNKVVNKTVMFCAGYPEGGKDACQGDSGGPIFTFDGVKITLVGVTSWGHGCARPEFPGVFTRLYKYADFFSQNI